MDGMCSSTQKGDEKYTQVCEENMNRRESWETKVEMEGYY
jgi:hypothetical protein